jgi:Rod binding domain-containing protein
MATNAPALAPVVHAVTPNDGPSARGAPPDRARETAEAFEAFFIAQLMEHMSAGLKTDGPFGGGPGEAAWRGQLNEAYGKTVAKRGGIGIADILYREMIKLQEVAK